MEFHTTPLEGGSEGNLIGLRRGGGGPECWALVSQKGGGIQYPLLKEEIDPKRGKGSPPLH